MKTKAKPIKGVCKAHFTFEFHGPKPEFSKWFQEVVIREIKKAEAVINSTAWPKSKKARPA